MLNFCLDSHNHQPISRGIERNQKISYVTNAIYNKCCLFPSQLASLTTKKKNA